MFSFNYLISIAHKRQRLFIMNPDASIEINDMTN